MKNKLREIITSGTFEDKVTHTYRHFLQNSRAYFIGRMSDAIEKEIKLLNSRDSGAISRAYNYYDSKILHKIGIFGSIGAKDLTETFQDEYSQLGEEMEQRKYRTKTDIDASAIKLGTIVILPNGNVAEVIDVNESPIHTYEVDVREGNGNESVQPIGVLKVSHLKKLPETETYFFIKNDSRGGKYAGKRMSNGLPFFFWGINPKDADKFTMRSDAEEVLNTLVSAFRGDTISIEKKDLPVMAKGGAVDGRIITFDDGFQFREVTYDYAKNNWKNESIYEIMEGEQTEHLVENEMGLDEDATYGVEIGFKKFLRGGAIVNAEGEGRSRLNFVENAILDELKRTDKNKIHAKIITKEGTNDKVKRYGKAIGGSVLEMSSKSKRRGFYLQDSYRQGWDNIVGVQFYEEPEPKTYAHELVLKQSYLQKHRHPNLWDDLAKDYSFTQEQLEEFAKATHGLSHYESWQKAGEMGLPRIESHKTITMKSAGMHEWDRKSLKDAIDNKRDYKTSWDCGMDCSVSAAMGSDGIYRAWFSQEYKGTGNGHYWLLISPEHAIFAEND